jgi:hypothetical protein
MTPSAQHSDPDAPGGLRALARPRVIALVVVPLVLLGAAFVVVPRVYENDLGTPFKHRQAAWTTSEQCRAGHPDHFESWYRTFHRTMNQEATPDAVVGAFNGEVVTYEGKSVRPLRLGDRFFMDYLGPNGVVEKRLPVVRTVGSRRYQQYLVQGDEGGNLFRVPLLWHIGEQRWLHLNGAFLDQDGQPFDHHLATWNQNCIFCHNTGPRPGLNNRDEFLAKQRAGRADPAFDLRFESDVAELGISCAACHAPGSEHMRRNRDPLRRYLLHFTGADDPTIVNPADLPHNRAAEVCGQCHAQRLPLMDSWIWQWLESGPSYRAGEPLRVHVRPIEHDTPPLPGAEADFFSLRFWPDGTPRLTAYEYQGLSRSACFAEGELTCVSCHTMHGGDVRGMIPEEMRTGARACGLCHADIVAEGPGHTRHDVGSSGSDCYACHMPKMVYGVLEIHRSHRIEVPDAARDAANARPNACTSCHVDRSLQWAGERMREWWGDTYRVPSERADGAPVGSPDMVAAMLAGDPVQRAVAARLAGRDDTPLASDKLAFLIPHLLLTLDNDYPTVRWFARLSLIAVRDRLSADGLLPERLFPELAEFDHLGPSTVRARQVEAMWEAWRAVPRERLGPAPEGALLDDDLLPVRARTDALIELQAGKNINIGE